MHQVSSSWTVILKFFLPVSWISIFASFALGAFLSDEVYLAGIPIQRFRIATLMFLLTGIAALYWMVMRLKRVDMDPQFFYVSNYRKTYRYSYNNVKRMVEKDWWLFRTVHLYFRKPGSFGKKICFVASNYRLNTFLKNHPEVSKALLE